MADRFLGIDLGTSGLKLAVVGSDGVVVAEAESAYTVDSPRHGWAETDPSAWLVALSSSLDAILPALAGIRAAGFAGQMHGAVLCAADGAALRPAVLWPDRRAVGVLDQWRALPETDRACLANPLAPGMTGPILAWLAEHEPDTVSRASTVVLPKDYVRHRLGGAPVTDRSDASATLLWDVVADGWSPSAVTAAGISAALLPDVVASSEVVGEATGDLAGVPLVAGGADTPVALLAAGPLDPGTIHLNLGTGAQVLRPVSAPKPALDPPVHLYADADDGWYSMAAVQNAGLALSWVQRVFDVDWPDFVALAKQSSPGAGGVSFLPFVSGERGAIAPVGVRGAWVGMGVDTTRADLLRAAVEGMVFAIRRGVGLLGAYGEPVRLTGGGGRDPFVRQLLANTLGVPVRRIEVRSASATGAAILAARGVGIALPVAASAGAEVAPRPSDEVEAAYRLWTARVDAAPSAG